MRQILHISDVHFGPYFVPETAEAIRELVERRRPDLVVLSGDLTQRAKKRQFLDAREWIDSLPAPHLVVPGNHDVPMYRVWERALSPYGAYRKYFADELEPVFEDDEIYAVGLNTAFNWTVKDGRVSRSALRRLREQLSDAPEGKARLVVAHHNLIPPPRFDNRRVAERAVELVRLLSHMRVTMVLSGHLHQSWVGTSEEYYPSGEHPVLLLHTGTTTSRRGRGWERLRHSCNWIQLDRQHVTISHMLWQPEARRFREWSRHLYPRRSAPGFALPIDDVIE